MSEKGRVVHVNSATLIMGPSGTGKSSLLATLIRYVWETFHKVTLLNSSDGGGFPTAVQALMQKGICRVFRMRTRDLPDGSLAFETCTRAAQGWWPQKINPATGEVSPGVKMVPPITEAYAMSCPNGHLVKTVPFQSLLTPTMCPKCKILTDKTNARIVRTSQRTKGFEDVGAVCFDGISSMLQWYMADMGARAGRLELKGEEGAIGGKIISGDMRFGQTTRSHVGMAQSQAENLVLSSLGIPYLVVPPTWTALTLETDDAGDLRILGPLIEGRAKTPIAPQWFGNCLESAVVKTERADRIFRLYLAEFTDEGGVRHLVKNRADPGMLPPYLEDPPLVSGHELETAFTNVNLGVFFQMLDEGLKASMERIDTQYADAPGLPEGIVEVGEPAAPEGQGAAPAAPSSVGKPAVAPVIAAGVQTGKPLAIPSGRPAAAPQPVVQPPPRPTVAPAVAPAQPQLRPPAQQWAKPAAPRPPAPAPRVGGPPRPSIPPGVPTGEARVAEAGTHVEADKKVPF